MWPRPDSIIVITTFALRLRATSRMAVAARVTAALLVASGSLACNEAAKPPETLDPSLVAQGKTIFRYETFGDETFWTDTLRMHEVIRGALDPTTALSVGLKVDADSLPPAIVAGIQNKSISLTSPATTVALLKLNAIVGVRGTVAIVDGKDVLTRVGVTCALCHSTVNNSFAPGIGQRLDGWPNHDLNPGAIIALSPALTAAQKAVYNSWGKGKYDARYNFDGKNNPSVIPPAYGLMGVNIVTYTGDGADLAYWNRYVAVTQMHGHGIWNEPRATPPEVVENLPDIVGPLLPALQAYQLSISAPPPPPGSFDVAAAKRGRAVFTGAGKCATCHAGTHFTDGKSLHSPSDVVSEPEPGNGPSFAARSATKMYRATPLRALWQHAPYFHNGVAPTLEAVVDLYDTRKSLKLTSQQKQDLVQYLKSL